MAYQISKFSEVLPATYPIYFFDANVWILILRNNQTNARVETVLQPYIDFFEGIINLNSITNPSIIKKAGNIPKIAITNMVLSEIINSYLRKVAMKAYLGANYGNSDFKKDYRDNIYSDYDNQLKSIVSDLQIFFSYCIFYDDDFKEIDPVQFITKLTRKVDYNDLYYSEQMKKLNIPIVTHDGDFAIEDITIITNHRELLRLK